MYRKSFQAVTIDGLAYELGTTPRALIAFSEDDSLCEYARHETLPEGLIEALRTAWANWESGKHDA